MEIQKQKLAAPCGLYCGVCSIRIAHRDDNLKLKERLSAAYGVRPEEIRCEGCLSVSRPSALSDGSLLPSTPIPLSGMYSLVTGDGLLLVTGLSA
jgi:hypothetical protein